MSSHETENKDEKIERDNNSQPQEVPGNCIGLIKPTSQIRTLSYIRVNNRYCF